MLGQKKKYLYLYITVNLVFRRESTQKSLILSPPDAAGSEGYLLCSAGRAGEHCQRLPLYPRQRCPRKENLAPPVFTTAQIRRHLGPKDLGSAETGPGEVRLLNTEAPPGACTPRLFPPGQRGVTAPGTKQVREKDAGSLTCPRTSGWVDIFLDILVTLLGVERIKNENVQTLAPFRFFLLFLRLK